MGFLDFLRGPDIDGGLTQCRQTPGSLLLDVRTPEEYAEGHIPGARNVPEEQLEQFLARQNRQKFFILYCQRGITSLYLGRKFAEKGYQIGALAGGMNAYEKWKL